MEDIFRELGAGNLKEFDTTTPTFINTDFIANEIKKSYVQPKVADLKSDPSWYKPNSNYLLSGDIGNTDKPSFETKNYNIEDAYARLNNGEYVARYDSYQEGRDNAEYAAQTQTTGEKWGNGLTKFIGKVATGIVGGTVGTVYGVLNGIKEGTFRATYDNDFLNYLDDLNQEMDYKLPNYYSKKEREGSFFDSMGTANFWADEVLGGGAFTVSAIGSEFIWAGVTGGGSLATTAARVGGRIAATEGRLARALSEMAKVKNLASQPILRTFANAKLPTNIATAFGKAGSLVNTARFTYTSAGFEAGTEARSYVREMNEKFNEEFIAKNGKEPTAEDRVQFEENLTKSANSLYGFNMAIVGSSNLLTIGRIFNMKSPLTASNKWVNSKLFGIGNNIETGVAQVATRGQKIARTAWSIGKSPLIEGVYEEGSQSVGSNTARRWIESTYDPKYLKNTMDMSEAFSQGLSDTYGTKEGMKEVGIGMIIGLLTGTGISIGKNRSILGELKEDVDKTKEIEKFYNGNYSPNQITKAIAYSGRMQASTEAADTAEQKGDFLGGELARQTAIIAQAEYAYGLDYFNETVERTEAGIRNIGDDAIMKEYGVPQEQVESIKEQLVSDYKSSMENYRQKREFADYFIGNKLTKDEQEKLGSAGIEGLKSAVAYELALGEKAHDFSDELLTSIKEEVGSSIFGLDVTTGLNIENVLLKAGEDTRKLAVQKGANLKRLESKRVKIEREYKEVERTLANTTDLEQKKKYLSQFDSLRLRLTEVEQEKQKAVQDYQLLVNTANLSNPFGKEATDLFITEENILNKEQDLKNVRDLVNKYNQTNPQRGLKLKKLLDEYGKSIFAIKRYADLSRQISDPKLGVRGKRNLITEITQGKNTNDITVEFLEGLRESAEQQATNNLENVQEVQEILARPDGDGIKPPSSTPPASNINNLATDLKVGDKFKSTDGKTLTVKVINEGLAVDGVRVVDNIETEEGVTVQNPLKDKKTWTLVKIENTTSENVSVPPPKKQDIKSFITETIKESPYLLEYYGSEQVPTPPTEEELTEFEELATKGLKDKKINKRTLSYEDPFNDIWFPQDGRNKVNLTSAEIKRLQELNEKLANWRLLEVYGSKDGVSIAEMLGQDVLTAQEVEPVIQTPELTDNDLQSTFEVNPTQTPDGEGIRPTDKLQTYEDVMMSESAKGVSIHHLTVSGLLSRLPYTTINYAKVSVKAGKETISDTRDNINITDVDLLSREGARFVITFDDFTQATVDVSEGGQLVFKNREDYTAVFEKAGVETKLIQTDPNFTGKMYFPVYDLATGKKLGTTFSDANTYSPAQIYDLLPGQVVEFSLDLFTDFNQQLLANFESEMAKKPTAKRIEELEAELMANIQISVADQRGQKLSDLKAAYNSDLNPQFLLIRQEALKMVKKSLEEGLSLTNAKQKIPYQTNIRAVMLGTPNFQYEDGRIKFFDIKPEKVENYGYTLNGKLVLKETKSEPVRTDFMKGMLGKDKVPFIVLRQGKYLIAVPIALNSTEVGIGDTFMQTMQENIDNGNKNVAQLAKNLNQLLIQNNISPKDYNLYFLDTDNQTMFNEQGGLSQSFTRAIDKLNSIRDMVDVESWMEKSHTKEMLAQEATSPIDTEDRVASSPKPIINLTEDGLTKLEGNWLDIAMSTGEIADERVTEIVDDILTDYPISPKVLELAQNNEKIQDALKEALKIEPSLKRKLSGILDDIDNC